MDGIDFNTAMEEMVEKKVQQYLPIIMYGKSRFTPEDIANLYGIHKDNARRMMNNGDFGEVIVVTPRNKVVTLEGLLAFEATHSGWTNCKYKMKPSKIKKHPSPGPI